jgi:hypothetical protein
MAVAVPLIAAAAGAAASAAASSALIGLGFVTAAGTLSAFGSIIAGLIGAVVTFGVGMLGSALFPTAKAKAPTLANDLGTRTLQVRQPITVHRIVLGRVRVSGPIVFLHTNASPLTGVNTKLFGQPSNFGREDLLYMVHILAAHSIAGVDAVFLDDTPLSDEKFRGLARVEWERGTPDQAANAMLMAETDGKWTAEHRLRGRAYLASSFKWDSAVWRNGIPNVSAIVRGADDVYDPRTGTVGYSNNAALLTAWYIASAYGWRVGYDEIDIPALIAAANICDEAVPLAAGGTEPRYTINGTFDADEPRERVLERLVNAMAGYATFTGGKWVIGAGAWPSPAAAITEDWLRGPVQVRANRAKRDLWNGVRAVYVRPSAGWQPTDAPPLIDAEALALDAGEESYTDLQLDFTTSGTMAQRIMQIALRRNRRQRGLTLPLNMRGLVLRAGDTVAVQLGRLPYATYRVRRWELAADGVDVSLEQEDAAVSAWDPATDERPLGELANADLPTGLTLPAPTVTITTPSAAEPSSIAGTLGAVTGASSYQAQWRGPGSSVWNDITLSGLSFTASTGGRAAFRARARSADDGSAWAIVDIPGAPTTLSATGTGSGIDVAWTLPVAGVRGQVFIGTTGTYASATKQASEPAGALTVTLPDDSPRYVWVRAVSAEGNIGPPTGPVVVARDGSVGGEVPGVDLGGGGGGDGGGGGGGGDGGE